MKAYRALGALPRRRAVPALAADDRRQRGAQPPALGRAARAARAAPGRGAPPPAARPRLRRRRCSPARSARSCSPRSSALGEEQRAVVAAATCSGCARRRPRRCSAAGPGPSSRGCRGRWRGWRRSCERSRTVCARSPSSGRRSPTWPRACARGWRAARAPLARAAPRRSPSGRARRGRRGPAGAQRRARLARHRRRDDRARPDADAGADAHRRSTSATGSRSPARHARRRARSAAPTRSTRPATSSRCSTARGPACPSPGTPAPARCCRSSPAARTRGYIRKFAGPDTRIERVTVDGEPGFWIAGAAARGALRGPVRHDRRAPRGSPATPWSGGTAHRTLRLEADVPKSRALAIARSIP